MSMGTRSRSALSGRKMKLLETAGLCCMNISSSRLMNVEIMTLASETTATRPSSAHWTQSGTSGLPAMRSRALESVHAVAATLTLAAAAVGAATCANAVVGGAAPLHTAASSLTPLAAIFLEVLSWRNFGCGHSIQPFEVTGICMSLF